MIRYRDTPGDVEQGLSNYQEVYTIATRWRIRIKRRLSRVGAVAQITGPRTEKRTETETET